MTKELLAQINALLRPLKIRIANSIARAVVNVVDDGKKMQLLQCGVLAGEDIDDAERFEQYGFKSVPKAGAEAVIVFPNGDRAHGIVVAVGDRRYRPTGWQPGEVGMFTDEAGHIIRMMRGKKTVFGADDVRIGSEGASDPVVRKSDLQAIVDIIDTHTHVYSPGPGGPIPTGPPVPVVVTATGSAKVKAD